MPIPVFPAIAAGTQPPDGVTETTQPSASAVSTDVVPAKNPSRKSGMRFAASGPVPPVFGAVGGGHFSSKSTYGFFPPWNGYGSPGLTFGSFFVQSIFAARAFA